MDVTQHASPATLNSVVRNQQTELDERAAKALLRKIDLRLLACLTIVFFFSYLDRNNLRNAKLLGFATDLQLSDSEYNWALWIFSFSYVLFEIPSILLMRRWSSSKWIASLVLTWGMIVMLMTLVHNLTGLLVARFILGMVLAGFFPGVVFYLSLWYIRKDQTVRIAIFMSGAILANAFDGILGYGIEQLSNGGPLAKWQWFFLAEGVSTVCLGIVTYKLLSDPATVQWLDQCEKDILTARLIADVKMIDDDDNESSSHQIRSVFLDWKMLFYMFINLGAVIPLYSINFFLSKVIEDDGYKHPNAELLIVPPYIVSCLATIISSWNAGRLNERSNHLMVLLFIQIIGYLYLILAQKYLYIGTIIVGIGVFSSNTLIVSWITNNTGDQTKRAIAIGLINSFGNIGGIISGQVYSKLDKASYHHGHYIIIGILGFTIVLTLLFKLLLKYENRRRRNLTIVQRQEETVADESQTLLDKYPRFVYVT